MVGVSVQLGGASGRSLELAEGDVCVSVKSGEVVGIQWPAEVDAPAVLGLLDNVANPVYVRLLHNGGSQVRENGIPVVGTGLQVPAQAIRDSLVC